MTKRITIVNAHVDDILICLRDSYPAEMRALDRIRFHACFTKMDVAAPRCEDQVRNAVLSKIPNANKYFDGNVSETGKHDRGHPSMLPSTRV
jgi:hypothetical protein